MEQKERTKGYEQQAADAREYAIMLEAELQRIYAGILALMDENLIPSASTGEPKAFYSGKKDDYYRFLAERATGDAKRQAPMIQKVLKTVEAAQIQYSDRILDLLVVTQRRIPTTRTPQRTVEVPKIVSQDRIPQHTAEQLVDIPVPQVTEEIIEMFNVLSQDRIQQRNVEQITEIPVASLDEEIAEAPKVQTQAVIHLMPQKRVQERTVEETDIPVPHMTKKTIEVVKFIPQERVQNRTVRQIIDVPVPRVIEENTKVEKLDSGCAVQAPEWEEPQRLIAEELMIMHDTNKLLKDSDSLELFKENLSSPSLTQVQSDKRGVASRNVGKVISMIKDVVSSFQQEQDDDDSKKTSCFIDIGRVEDADTSIALNTTNHESATADPTAAAQHRSTQQHNNHRKQWQQAGQTEEDREEEKGRKDGGGRDQEGRRKEKEREPGVKKDVTDWTVVTKNRRQRKMIQIFVRVNGSKATPIEVNLTDDKVEDVMRRIQNDEDAYVTLHGRALKRSEKLRSCEVTDGCTMQVTSRLRGGGKHNDKKSRDEKK